MILDEMQNPCVKILSVWAPIVSPRIILVMTNALNKIGDTATRITNPFSLAALALLLAIYPVCFSGDIKAEAKPWLVGAMLASAVVMLMVLRGTAPQPATKSDDWLTGAKNVVDSSNLPMYLTDSNLTVVHCNDRLANIIDSDIHAIVGKHLIELVRRFGDRVPKDRQAHFMKRQQSIVNRALSDLATHSEDVDIIDNSDLAGNSFQGRFRVWIHADKIKGKGGKSAGLFVIYHPERLELDNDLTQHRQ